MFDRVYAAIAINKGVPYEPLHANRTPFVRFSVIGLQNIKRERGRHTRPVITPIVIRWYSRQRPLRSDLAFLIRKTILRLIIENFSSALRETSERLPLDQASRHDARNRVIGIRETNIRGRMNRVGDEGIPSGVSLEKIWILMEACVVHERDKFLTTGNR